MASIKKKMTRYRTEGNWMLSVILTIPMALILFVMLTGGRDVFTQAEDRFAFSLIYVLNLILFYKMLVTGKTDKYRAVLFIIFALALSFTFITNMVQARGNMTFDHADVLQCKVPFCHIVTTMILIPGVLSQSIIFPGTIDGGYASIASMLVIVAGACLVLGRGFCSWGCFYGGWDDGFSRIRKKSLIKNPPSFLKWGGIAVLILVALTSAGTLVPTYCDWVCPFKAVTEFEAVTSVETGIKTGIFGALFLGLVVGLPILTKKRTQCAWFCPMGALCSLSNSLSIYQLRMDRNRCIQCGKCIRHCPMQALDAESLESGKPHFNCVKCGRCADVCPTNSIGYHIKLTKVLGHPTISRVLFLYAAFSFLAIFSSGSIQGLVQLLLHWAATGSLLS